MIRSRSMVNRKSALYRRATVLALAVAGWALPCPVRPAIAAEPSSPLEQSARPNYGRTPDSVIPYRNFREPYVRFFQEATPYRGSGRDSKAAALPEAVRIGILAPSGSAPDADLGQQMSDGITLAIEQANSSGGYQGIPFQTVPRRDAGLWGSSANEMVALEYDDDVLAVIGSIDGANTHIALRVALKTQMPMVNTATTDPTLTETSIPWLLRCMADDRQQGYALAHYIFNERGIEKVAAFRVNDRYGRTGIAEFRDAARRLKHPLRVELRWDRGARDFGKQLDRIARTKSEAVVLWGNAADTAAIVREMRRRNMPQLIFGCDRLASRSFLEQAGEAADGVVAVASFNPTDPNPRYRAFVEGFQERFGRSPDGFAAHAYDGANILIESIRKAGLNRVRVRDALYEYRSYEGVTGAIEFDTTLNDIGPVYIAVVKDGRYEYQPVKFTKVADSANRVAPYRTMSEAPPQARFARVSTGRNDHEALRIGCFLPLDPQGQSAARGLNMALEDDAVAHPDEAAIELVVRDSRGVWGDNSNSLADLVVEQEVLALVGSTERRGTHLMETLAAKLHVPLITFCGSDPTIHAIPLPWVFSVAPAEGVTDDVFARRFARRFGEEATREAAMGYDAGLLLAGAIRGGSTTRTELRNSMSATTWHRGASGTFRFGPLGRRVDKRESVATKESSTRVSMRRIPAEE